MNAEKRQRMSIVRSLLISIGFVNDKKAINETNKAITGFKTRFALVATTAAYAFKVVNDFFSSIAAATLDTEELATALGITLNELVAMQQAAQKFRIRPEQFSGALSILQKDLNELRQGFGRLPELLRNMGIEVDRQSVTATQLFDLIVKRIGEIDNEQDRIRISSQVFSSELGVRISRLSQDFDGFKDSVKSAYEELEKTPNIIPQLTEYEQSVNSITNSLSNLFKTLVVSLGPAIKEFADYLQKVVQFYTAIFSLDFGALKSSASAISDQLSSIGDSLFNKFERGINAVTEYFRPYVEVDENAPRPAMSNGVPYNWVESQLPAGWVSYVNNSVDLNVPQGTTAEQAAFLGGQIEEMISASINATFNEIQYNNPVVE